MTRLAVCRRCGKRVRVMNSPFRRNAFTTFEARPVDAREAPGAHDYPAWRGRVYQLTDLTAELQSAYRCTVEDAHEQAIGMPRYRLHRCRAAAAAAAGDP